MVASVDDPAGNTGPATQVLTVDVTVPVVTIDGGATRSTKDTSPWTYGTTAEKDGTVVHVGIGGQALTATVHDGGKWGVSAADLDAGRYKVVASITDAAHNTGTATQLLTVGNPRRPRPPVPARRGRAAGQGLVRRRGELRRRTSGSSTSWASTPAAAKFEVRLTNRGDAADALSVRGASKTKKFKVTYRVKRQERHRARSSPAPTAPRPWRPGSPWSWS